MYATRKMALKFGTLDRDDIPTIVDEDEDDEFNDEGVPWFYINKGGFPIDKSTWERMWTHIVKIHPDGTNVVNKIRHCDDLAEKPIPAAPVCFAPCTSVFDRLQAVQDYMKELEYPCSMFLVISACPFICLSMNKCLSCRVMGWLYKLTSIVYYMHLKELFP